MSERRLVHVFEELADALAPGFDTIDLLRTLTHRTVELIAIDAAGILLTDEHGHLTSVASTTEPVHTLEQLEVADARGPCYDCFTAGRPLVNLSRDAASARWPRFQHLSTEVGFGAVHAVPLRLRDQVIGSLNMFCVATGSLSAEDIDTSRALARITAIGLLHKRAASSAQKEAAQLRQALTSRIIIEQAKGMLAESAGCTPAVAFDALRRYARTHGRPLHDVAAEVVHGTLTPPTSG
ncbi:GAF and ANTAR domain-containing protein [Prescottella agglutinans]|uniref:GAF domain-containing protein n=1 Tax=Prescottella agglutinans TaxID=1644129 RepID=A0ABT6MKV9_9NOCA|nr:GAF and ANTAR domain-containing protein [Prescottella agglutinans]MDH6284860.1 GAF domain-containing protein [Prescottella agglutinans]